jgi:hypothetical protein
MLEQMCAVVVNPSVERWLVLQHVARSSPLPSEATVRVAASSLNLGLTRLVRLMTDEVLHPQIEGRRIFWQDLQS